MCLLEYPNANLWKTIAIAQPTSMVLYSWQFHVLSRAYKFQLDSKQTCRLFYIIESIKYHEHVSQNSKLFFVVKPSNITRTWKFPPLTIDFFWINSLTICIVNNKKILLQLSPSFWNKGDIIKDL